MRVYNLSTQELSFRGRTIAPNGGSVSCPELDTFISDRDRALAKAGVISLGALPASWRPPVAAGAKPPPLKAQKAQSVAARIAVEDAPAVAEEAKVESTWTERSIGKKAK